MIPRAEDLRFWRGLLVAAPISLALWAAILLPIWSLT